jgi:2-polyprenyl-6-methoxyphenol hydroxylase-like FAD-dependent oxidoreductase
VAVCQTSARSAAAQQGSHATAPAVRHACVVGGGLAGLACSIAAAACGVRVDLFDQASALPAKPAFIDVVPNMLRDLVGLGVADECVRAGFPYHGLDVIDRQGRLRLEVPTPRLAGMRYPAALGIEHDELLRILDRCARSHGVRMHPGTEIVGMERRGELAVLRLSSGEAVATELVVLAAGVEAPLRTALFAHAVGRPHLDAVRQVSSYTLVPRPLALQRATLFVGVAGRKVMLVPVRGDLAGVALMEPVQEADNTASSKPAEHLRKALMQFPAQVQDVARQLRDDTAIARRIVCGALLHEPWHHEQVIAVGNAAHAMPPHFGQAGAQALEDAAVLAELLICASSATELAHGFTARRFPRARQVHEIATTAARWELEPESSTDLRELSARLSRLVAEPA